MISLYDSDTIDRCVWPANRDGQYGEKLLAPLVERGVASYIENVSTDLQVLICGDLVFPITVNEAEYENSYVCSPYSHYISYARESLGQLMSPLMGRAIRGLLWGSSQVLRGCQINKVVTVNNWLFSTSLYPQMEGALFGPIVEFLRERFPDYAILFRSIDPHTSPGCYQALKGVGCDYIASRQIYFIHPRQSTLLESRLFKTDLRQLNMSGYTVEEGISPEEYPRLLELYEEVYLKKYSQLNPRFNADYLGLLQQVMHFKALKKEGRIDGVVGYMQRHGMMFCPFFGYDQSLPQEVGLYRHLSTLLMLEAHDKDLLFHQSSGASTFKKMRKAQPCIEYLAVYHRHLKWKRQLPWRALQKMCNSIGLKYMQKY